jgi:hypothetical protein
MPYLFPIFQPQNTSDQNFAHAVEERLRTDSQFRATCLFWANFYEEMERNSEVVSPLVKEFVDELYDA